MKRLLVIFFVLSILAMLSIHGSYAESYSIPSWVKNNAKWWSEEQLGDSDFTQGIQYLIQQGIMKIPQTNSSSTSSNGIPVWIKNNAKWWSEGTIDDSDFVKSMQYLVQSGIIHVDTSKSQTTQANQQTTSQSTCNAINGIMPDPICTPGATDPRVTQDNIQSTICVSGYTKTVRPPTSVTGPIKIERMKAYGYTDSLSNYELDHLIPLELGGAPTDIKNLWPEPYYTSITAYNKDSLENYLHTQVCSGTIDLKTAQNEIATNWLKYWSQAHLQATQVPDEEDSTSMYNTGTSVSPSQSQVTQPSNSQAGTLHVDLKGQSPITRGNVQYITISVTDGINPVSGSAVSAEVYYVSGSTTKNFGGTSDSSGQFSFSWKIGGNSTPGTFKVVVDAQKGGYASGHDTFSFQVVPAS